MHACTHAHIHTYMHVRARRQALMLIALEHQGFENLPNKKAGFPLLQLFLR